jgi:hypothetical protein
LTNPNDWLEITIKFRGKCCECGKEITSGQALWSKSTKAVKHLNCPSRNANNKAIASMSLEESTTHEPGKKEFATAQQISTAEYRIKMFYLWK